MISGLWAMVHVTFLYLDAVICSLWGFLDSIKLYRVCKGDETHARHQTWIYVNRLSIGAKKRRKETAMHNRQFEGKYPVFLLASRVNIRQIALIFPSTSIDGLIQFSIDSMNFNCFHYPPHGNAYQPPKQMDEIEYTSTHPFPFQLAFFFYWLRQLIPFSIRLFAQWCAAPYCAYCIFVLKPARSLSIQ